MDVPDRGFVFTDDHVERLNTEPITDPVEATEFLGRLLDDAEPAVVDTVITQVDNLNIAESVVKAAELYGAASVGGIKVVC